MAWKNTEGFLGGQVGEKGGWFHTVNSLVQFAFHMLLASPKLWLVIDHETDFAHFVLEL